MTQETDNPLNGLGLRLTDEDRARAYAVREKMELERRQQEANDLLTYGRPLPGWDDEPQPPTEEPTTPPVVLRHLAEIVAEKREPRWLIHRQLEAGVLAVLAGQRSTFKSFIALDWMMRIAQDGKPVVILSGEGAGLDRRADAWMRTFAPDRALTEFQILCLERPLRLTVDEELLQLVTAIEAAGIKPACILIDTYSKFSAGLDENDNAEVAGFLSRLSRSLRERFDATVLIVAHAGHGDAKRPRGASALMANPDAEYIVDRPLPTAMTVTVSRERFKDYPALPAIAYEAETIDLGRSDAYGERVTSLIMRDTAPPAPKVKAGGQNQTKTVTALKEWLRSRPDANHISTPEFHELLEAQGIPRTRRYEMATWLVQTRILTASVGGWSVDRGAL